MAIVGSFTVKVNLHDDDEQAVKLARGEITLEQIEDSVEKGIEDNLGYRATAKAERTDD